MGDHITVGFVPLVDCAVLVAAREVGFAHEEGLSLELVREPSWASLRDHLNLGFVDAAHALAPLPIASALGISQVRMDSIVPFVLGRGGNAITVSNRLSHEIREWTGTNTSSPLDAAEALGALVRRSHKPLTLAMVYPFSGHNFELRYWLAAGGVHPDRDVRLVAVPPPLMVASLRAGHVDGFCVGEPWNSLAVSEGLGEVIVTKSQIFPHGIEKVLAAPRSMEARPELLGSLLRALDAAARWADDSSHRKELASLLARPEYVNLPASLIGLALDGRVGHDAGCATFGGATDFLYFHRDGANVPQREEALWLYAQMARWGQLAPSADVEAHVAAIFREDLYRRYVDAQPEAPDPADSCFPPAFDGMRFTSGDIEQYLARFALRTRPSDRASDLQL